MILQIWEHKNRISYPMPELGSKSGNYVIYTFLQSQLGLEVTLMSFPNRTMVRGYNLDGVDYIATPVITQEITEISEFVKTSEGFYCTTSLMDPTQITIDTRWRAKQDLDDNDLVILVLDGELTPIPILLALGAGLQYYGNNEYGFSSEMLENLNDYFGSYIGLFFAESTWNGDIPTIDTEVVYVKTDGGINSISVIPTSNTNLLIVYCNDTFDSLGYCNKDIITEIDGSKCTSVTNIGDEAFRNCLSLTNITIPNSVTSIGNWAFYGCSGLTSIVVGSSVTSIGGSAFYNCIELKTVINFSNLTFTNYSLSYGCIARYASNVINAPSLIDGDYVWLKIDNKNVLAGYLGYLSELTLPPNYKGENYAIGNRVFTDNKTITSITIPNSVTSMGYDAFKNCTSLTSIVIPNRVTSFGHAIFKGCVGLTNVTISEGITNIGTSMFYSCTSLTSIEIPNSVTDIGSEAFRNCSSLSSVHIGAGVTNIGGAAFSETINLNSIVVDTNNTVYDSRENCNAIIETATNTLIKGCNTTVIPNSVTSIGSPAFYSCSRLTSITIPNSVTSIGDSAFNGCLGLTSITCLAIVAPTIGSNTFKNIPTTGTLKIPEGSDYSSWNLSGWTVETL